MSFAAFRPASAAPNVSTNGLLNPYPALLNGGLRATDSSGPINPYQGILGAGSSTSGTSPAAPAAAQPLTVPQGSWTLPNGSTIDYTQLLSNDPLLQQQLSGIQAQDASNQAAIRASEQQALIGYGSVPSGLANIPGLSGTIDQTTQDLASQNTASGLSTYAKLQNAYKQSVQGTDNNLAARGMLRSGAFGQENANDLLGYNQAQSTAVGQLNQYLAGVYNGYLSQQQQLQQQEYGAYNTALQNLIMEIQAGLIGGGTGPGGGSTPTSGAAGPTGGAATDAYGGPYYQNPGPNVIETTGMPIPRPGRPVYA